MTNLIKSSKIIGQKLELLVTNKKTKIKPFKERKVVILLLKYQNLIERSSPTVKGFLSLAEQYDKPMARKALIMTVRDFWGKCRKNGVDQADHPVSVALLFWEAWLREDAEHAALLLHDSVEEGARSIIEIYKSFGDEIADYVDCFTKKPEEKFSLSNLDRERAYLFISRYLLECYTDRKQRVYLPDYREQLRHSYVPADYLDANSLYYERLKKYPFCIAGKSCDKADIFKDSGFSLKIKKQQNQIIEYETVGSKYFKDVREGESENCQRYKEILFSTRDMIEYFIALTMLGLRQVKKNFYARKKILEQGRIIADLKARLAQYKTE